MFLRYNGGSDVYLKFNEYDIRCIKRGVLKV